MHAMKAQNNLRILVVWSEQSCLITKSVVIVVYDDEQRISESDCAHARSLILTVFVRM